MTSITTAAKSLSERIRELTGLHQKHGLDVYFSALQDSAGTERYYLRLSDRTDSSRSR